jgi:hypothetical protein
MGAFIDETVLREKIGSAAVAGANEIQQFLLSVDFIFAGAIKAHPRLAIFAVNAVMHSRWRMLELPRQESLHGRAACLSHGRCGVVLIDFRVTLRASLVPEILVPSDLQGLRATGGWSLLR